MLALKDPRRGMLFVLFPLTFPSPIPHVIPFMPTQASPSGFPDFMATFFPEEHP